MQPLSHVHAPPLPPRLGSQRTPLYRSHVLLRSHTHQGGGGDSECKKSGTNQPAPLWTPANFTYARGILRLYGIATRTVQVIEPSISELKPPRDDKSPFSSKTRVSDPCLWMYGWQTLKVQALQSTGAQSKRRSRDSYSNRAYSRTQTVRNTGTHVNRQ